MIFFDSSSIGTLTEHGAPLSDELPTLNSPQARGMSSYSNELVAIYGDRSNGYMICRTVLGNYRFGLYSPRGILKVSPALGSGPKALQAALKDSLGLKPSSWNTLLTTKLIAAIEGFDRALSEEISTGGLDELEEELIGGRRSSRELQLRRSRAEPALRGLLDSGGSYLLRSSSGLSALQ